MQLRSTSSLFAVGRFFCSSSLSKITTKPLPLNGYSSEELIHLENSSKIPIIFAKWKEEGHLVVHDDVALAVHRLMSTRRPLQALEIWDFVVKNRTIELKPPDYASHISLIAKFRGLFSVEIYFDGIPEEMKGGITYSALLRIYCNKGAIAKAEALMQKMAEGGFLTTAHPYIHMMSLYMKYKKNYQAGKMFEEVKKFIDPDFNICSMWLDACASRNYVDAAEMVFSEMKKAKVMPNRPMYGTLAHLYLKNKMFEKATSALKEMEDILFTGDWKLDCSSLIRMHGDIGNKDEILRIWDKLKLKFGRRISAQNYSALVSALLEVGSYEKADELYSEWKELHKGSKIPMIRDLWRKPGKKFPVLK